MRKYLLILLFAFVFIACEDEVADLPPFEERVAEAINGLRTDLTAPTNGWRLEYQPTPEAGTFLILMKFFPDGSVNIKSDVPDGNGEFYDHTITYRIDNALGLQLIFETFGVFHHLFELEQATFGAEFEFLYKRKEGDNLIFESLSDFNNPTILSFQPAGANDEGEFARGISENLIKFKLDNPQIFGTILPTQQIILHDRNISIFWTIDLDKRNLVAEFAGIGTTRDQVLANNRVNINQFSKFTYANGNLVLDEPFSFALNGQQNNIQQIPLSDFSFTGPELCASSITTEGPLFTGQSQSLGSVTVVNSLLSNRGSDFVTGLYTVNAFFIFDEQTNSLQQTGIISQLLPGTSALIMVYGVSLIPPFENIPMYSVGFIMENGEIYVREFQPTSTKVNLVQINLLNQYYYTATPPAGTEQSLMEITDELFQGGEFYAFNQLFQGIDLFWLFNPCNKYEFLLIE